MKRSVGVSVLLTAGLLAVFYSGVWALPRIVHRIAARSLYNYRDQAEAAIALDNYDGAVGIIERASREIPRDIYFERPEYMYDWIGRIRKQQGQTTESLHAFLRAQVFFFHNIQLRGYFPPSRLIHDILEGYFAADNFGGAYEEVRAAFSFYPMLKDQFLGAHAGRQLRHPVIMRDTGLLYIQAGRVAEGQARLRDALTRDSRLPDAHLALGRLDEQKCSTDSAVREYEAELAVNPCAEEALLQLIRLGNRTDTDTAPLAARLAEMRSHTLAEYVPTTTSVPLASLWGIGSKLELALNVPEPSPLVFNILARSTPCYGLYGWLEFTLDGRHVQNLYVDSLETRVYPVRAKRIEAGPHRFRIEVLSDATDGAHDRNTFIESIRVYRSPAGSP